MNKNVVKIISPSDDITKIPLKVVDETKNKFKQRTGLEVKYSEHLFEEYTPEKAIEDLYNAYTDKDVRFVMCYKGGQFANRIVHKIDYDIIMKNRKPMIGYSDNAILLNAIYLKTGQKNYYGPAFAGFNMDLGFEFTLDNFNKVVRDGKKFQFNISKEYSYDRKWYKEQDNRKFIKNKKYMQVINPGNAEGVILGGHLSSLDYLVNNSFEVKDTKIVLIVEEDGEEEEKYLSIFKKKLQSVIGKIGIEKINAILIGRSQFPIDIEKWDKVIKEMKLTMPIACNLDFGHTNPTLSIPIGEKIKLELRK